MYDWNVNNAFGSPAATPLPDFSNYSSYSGGVGQMNSNFSPTAGVQMPVTGGQGAATNNSGFGFNSNTVGMVMGGLQALGSLWNAYNQQKLAKEQFKFQKQAWQTNLANQTKTYNTALEDRIRARHFTEGKSSNETNDYIATHRL